MERLDAIDCRRANDNRTITKEQGCADFKLVLLKIITRRWNDSTQSMIGQ